MVNTTTSGNNMSKQLTTLLIFHQTVDKNINFESIVAQSIDQTLSVFGETVKDAIYKVIDAQYGIKKHEIANNLELFSQTIESLFGQAAKLIEIRIIQTLNSRVKDFTYKPETAEVVFVDYIAALQKHMSKL
jgi:hypothetical protein